MPAKLRRIAFILATAIALSTAPSAQALQAPDIHTVDLVPGDGSSAARGFTRLNGWDYFVTGGSNRLNATGIWRTNGATTELVAEDLTIQVETGDFEIGAPRAFAALGNYLYFTADDGITSVVSPGDKLNVVSRNELGEYTWSSPAIAHGRIYIRGEQHLFAIGKP